ncbi:beta-microseminoprotein-like [Scyliorhinus torazame]|uniref:beta-microseminoprotein-like n=1 Tax=Scyliorhinus torazame TaxID=75743 RepID=UPI003B5B163E
MKFLVCVALLLLAVRYGESSCYRAPQQGIYKITKTCRDDVDGTWHADSESWKNSDCMRCACMSGLMECCTTYGSPVGYSEDCIAVFDRQNCLYRVHLKNDSSIECPVYFSIGK